MMKIPVCEIEFYPFYHIASFEGDYDLEFSDEEGERIKRVMKEFAEVQSILDAKYEEAYEERRRERSKV